MVYETPQEIGSRTAKGGYSNENDIIEMFDNWKNDKIAQNFLKIMGFRIEDIQSLRTEKVGGRKKTDIQLFIKDSNKIITKNISLKKQNSQGYNHIGRKNVDYYCDLFDFSQTTRIALNKYCGVSGYSPSDLLKSGRIDRQSYLNLRDIPEKVKHSEEEAKGGRFFLDELHENEVDSILNDFTAKLDTIIFHILNGDEPEYFVDWFIFTKNDSNQINISIEPIAETINRAKGSVYLSNATKGSGSNLRFGPITVQKKGGTGGATQLQFKWKNIFPE